MEVSAIADLSVQFQTLTIARSLLPRQSCSISSTDAVAPLPSGPRPACPPPPPSPGPGAGAGKGGGPLPRNPTTDSDLTTASYSAAEAAPMGPSAGAGRVELRRGRRMELGEDPPPSRSDPVFEFFYEVLCWIVLSNISHAAFKKFARLFEDGIADPSREKVVSMC